MKPGLPGYAGGGTVNAAVPPPACSREHPDGPVSASRRRDADRQRGGVTAVGGDRLLGAGAAGREHPDGPVARRGEEAEPAVLAQRDLGDELAVVVQQPGVPDRSRGTGGGHRALDDGLTGGVLGHRDPARWRAAALRLPAHRPAPSSIGTPTREPYSVQDPS